MNTPRVCSLLHLLSAPHRYTSVRFAQRRTKQFKRYHDLTDMALWRKERGLDTNPNVFGPLTNLPDYSYLDGRPVPLGRNMERRLERQRAYAERIVLLSKEIDWAKEHHQKKLTQAAAEKDEIISNKLKPKGDALLNLKKK